MRIGLVNLMTRTADDLSARSGPGGLAPANDSDLNIVEMGRRMVKGGHQVNIYISDAYRPRSPFQGSPELVYLPTRIPWAFPPSLAPLTPSLPRRLRRDHLDVVQSGEVFQPGTFLSWSGTKNEDTAFFVWQELDILMRGAAGWAQRKYYRFIGRGMVKGCSALIPRSLSAREHLIRYGFPEEKIAPVVHSGVDTNVFSPRERTSSRARFDIPQDAKVVLSVGRLHENKGMDILIKAIEAIRKEHTDIMLIIKGTGPQGEVLASMIKERGLDRHVRLLTDRLDTPSMAELYSCANVLAVTSRVDLFPFTAIESISCGVPVATSYGRGLRSDIVEKGAGTMVGSEPAKMAEILRHYWRMTRGCAPWVEQEGSWPGPISISGSVPTASFRYIRGDRPDEGAGDQKGGLCPWGPARPGEHRENP